MNAWTNELVGKSPFHFLLKEGLIKLYSHFGEKFFSILIEIEAFLSLSTGKPAPNLK